MTDSTSGYFGLQSASTMGSEFNSRVFMVQQIMSRMATSMPVKVLAVDTVKQTVNVQPMVSQVTGQNNVVDRGTIFNLPYVQYQGGGSALIIDPVVGDIGLGVFCSHDISTVKATKDVAAPGSARRFSWSDGVYIGGFLNSAPVNYIRISGEQIDIVHPAMVSVVAPTINLDGNVSASGNLSAGNGITCSFTTTTGQVVTVQNGIVTNLR